MTRYDEFAEWEYEAIVDVAERWNMNPNEAEAALEEMGVF